MPNIDQIGKELAPYLIKVGENGRRDLAKKIATALRRSQANRIRKQKNPDSTDYTPRANSKNKKNLFNKIRTYKFLKQKITDDAIAIAFFGRIARIAGIHQHGEIDRPAKGQAPVRYPERILLGFTDEDIELIEKISKEFLSF